MPINPYKPVVYRQHCIYNVLLVIIATTEIWDVIFMELGLQMMNCLKLLLKHGLKDSK